MRLLAVVAIAGAAAGGASMRETRGTAAAAEPATAPRPRIVKLVDDYSPVFSPNGETIVFERLFSMLRFGVDTHPRPMRSVLIRMRADGSRKRALRHRRATFESDASFSADGRSILFIRNGDIFVMQRDGSQARRVRADALDQACPRLSPNERKIVFWRGRVRGRSGYFVMNADGSGARRVVDLGTEPPWGCPSWFPDSKRLVFAKRYNLYVTSLESGRTALLTTGRNTLYRPTVSPDGQWIACDGNIANRAGYGIIVLRADGGRMRRITVGRNEIENDSGAAWSPDGRRIVFSGYRGRLPGAGVYVVNRDGRGLRRLSNFRGG